MSRHPVISLKRLVIAALVWGVLSVAGTIVLIARDARAAQRDDVPRVWPGESTLPRAQGAATLLMFVHPNCPCTRASAAQLLRIVSDARETASPKIVFVVRPAATEDWRAQWLLARAQAVPGSVIVRDADRAEARRFGATASGQILLYSADGALLFDGGITAGRGHEGENDGAERLLNALRTGSAAPEVVATFGCELRGVHAARNLP